MSPDHPTLVGPVAYLAAALALLGGGRMLLEGIRGSRLDEVTRSSTQHIQQLGGWARVLVEMGIHPRSATTNVFFIVYGGAWLALTAAFAQGHAWARWGVFAAALGSLWYLGPGTLISLAVMVLILFARR